VSDAAIHTVDWADIRLFSCEYRQQIIYKTAEGIVDAQTPVNSVFVHPIIGVEEEGKDLYDCLGELYLGGADIEYEGKKGHMMDLMDKFPPMLYIQMRVSSSVQTEKLTEAIAIRSGHAAGEENEYSYPL